MKYLYIIRHAKAEASTSQINDHNRKLTNKGIDRAKNLNNWFKNKTPNIEGLFTSSSIRTLQTTDILCNGMIPPIKKIVDKKLYAASEEYLITYISFIEEN